jgi:hypothetical protein
MYDGTFSRSGFALPPPARVMTCSVSLTVSYTIIVAKRYNMLLFGPEPSVFSVAAEKLKN